MHYRANRQLAPDVIAYLDSRGLCPDTASRYGWGTAYRADLGRFENAVAVPSFEGGALVGWQLRRLVDKEPRFLTVGQAGSVPWNVDCLDDPTLAREPLIITEGRFDALALLGLGFAKVISAPGGGNEKADPDQEPDPATYPWLEKIAKKLGTSQVIIATDNDPAGHKLGMIIARRLGEGRCRMVPWSAGDNDVNGLLSERGNRAVLSLLHDARWVPVPGVYRRSELPVDPPRQSCISGMPGLDRHWRLRTGDLTVLTGWPSCGKTSFLNDLAVRMARNNGWSTCFASFEQPALRQHVPALQQILVRKPVADMTAEEVLFTEQFIDRHFAFIEIDDSRITDLVWLLDTWATAVIRYGVKLCIVDPWNELEHAVGRDQTLTQYIGTALRALKHFARRWDVHVIVAAHPAKPQLRDGKTMADLPPPNVWQISDSANWWNKSDVALVLHRCLNSLQQHVTEVHVQKTKYEDEIGEPGIVAMTFDRATKTYAGAPR